MTFDRTVWVILHAPLTGAPRPESNTERRD